MKSLTACGLSLFAALSGSPCQGYFASDAGRPAARPLPMCCQMGKCAVQTVEAIDAIAFAAKGVLFRVESQNWESTMGAKKLTRGADTTSYVLCSKVAPAVIDQQGQRDYIVTFLWPSEADSYNHANETALAMYFVVCHSRAFDHGSLFDKAPLFAASIGYSVHAREDQPKIDSPEKALDYVK